MGNNGRRTDLKNPSNISNTRAIHSHFYNAVVHPSLVSDKLKQQAHDFMVEVNAAYEAQDIPRLEAILIQLKNNALACRGEMEPDKEVLSAQLTELKNRYTQVQDELDALITSEEYQDILAIGNEWESYFADLQQHLESIAEQLAERLEEDRLVAI